MSKTKTPKQLAQEHRYELIAFLTGFSLLVLEIVGGRLIAPYFGTSIYIWTATIGVILGALAVGTVIGGQKADEGDPIKIIRTTTFSASLAVLGLAIVQQPILAALAALDLDLRISATLAALLLFSLPSYLIGVVGPNLAKLNVTSLEVAGRSVGRIEAASTIGSIAGTFAAGYFLLGWFGSRSIILGVALLLFTVALLAGLRARPGRESSLLTVLLVTLCGLALISNQNPPSVVADTDTSYARYRVFQADLNGTPIRALATDGQAYQSGVQLTNPTEPVFSYMKNFVATAEVLEPKQVLIIGGGTFTFSSVLNEQFTTNQIAKIDTVEIDPELTKLARQHFFYKDSPRLTIINQDGRYFLNKSTQTYDAIYADAYSAISPPFQLTTVEAVRNMRDRLTSNGVLISNVIGRYDDGNGEFLQAIAATYRTQFKYVKVYQSDPSLSLALRQNFIVIASNAQSPFDQLSKAFVSAPLNFKYSEQVLTDDFAPVERLTY